MIPILKDILPSIERWPEADQLALAEAAREIEARRAGFYVMAPDETAAVGEGLAQADRGEFASEAEMIALWKRYGA